MASPRVKRPFAGQASDPSQRQITSFFDRDNGNDGERPAPADCPSLERRSSTPLLPPSVQANLLAVGMRVRKSVPEGYKTGKEETEGSPVVAPRRTALPAAALTPTLTTAYSSPAAPSHRSYSYHARPTHAPRELAPFCGLHRIGGLGVQPWSDSNDDGRPLFSASLFDGGLDEEDGAAPPSLTSSQETVSSTASSSYAPPSAQPSRGASASARFAMTSFGAAAASTRKRFYGQEEDEDAEDASAGAAYQNGGSAFFQVHEDARLPVSSSAAAAASSASINSWLTDGHVGMERTSFNQGRRVLAVPRRRHATNGDRSLLKQSDSQQRVRFVDQENAEILGDFGEADFLDASMLAEGSGEHDMEMGGM
ncbi:uncharacterized protein SPSK_09481 [Sporothrix schenckii 1099-18]|uniref:Uncharacterized protein n=2 Tax=Sporothrix schenckii TaxID=29908 RepID=U7PWI0_SPOS1|nr:uncharacterized protein SPSK_09481 [Sporothrix schenckii 1099-18]ERS99993.1 hypothetical protein HMPREF1624_03363 [Sporothrix schenckii ATCC 58251]KJR85583.1 hypothetical protein SPSK_09481 [Sporothrix schenckii 1099-18]